jgi:cell wall-associated NlpC family hydrolase
MPTRRSIPFRLGKAAQSLRLVVRLAAVGVLLVTASGCDQAVTEPALDYGMSASVVQSPVSDASAIVAPGGTLSLSRTVTNSSAKRLSVDVIQTIRSPDGTLFHEQQWPGQTVPPRKSITLGYDVHVPFGAPPGRYSIAVLVLDTRSRQVLLEDASAGYFMVAETGWTFRHVTDPDRIEVSDARGNWAATFTYGAGTVHVAGPVRTFAEVGEQSPAVTHGVWVRLLGSPFAGLVDEVWLNHAIGDSSPDVLAFAMQYLNEAPDRFDASGMKIAGDADYGPLQEDGTRLEGADWNDYLGVDWVWNGKAYAPRPDMLRSIDCSGFIQMVFGYRAGLPMSRRADGTGISRTARGNYTDGLGIITVPNSGLQVTDMSRLGVGDLVFFDTSGDGVINHVGMFLGRDAAGHHRFVSSIKRANGPTMGDSHLRQILETINGKGYYALGFRAVRRM